MRDQDRADVAALPAAAFSVEPEENITRQSVGILPGLTTTCAGQQIAYTEAPGRRIQGQIR